MKHATLNQRITALEHALGSLPCMGLEHCPRADCVPRQIVAIVARHFGMASAELLGKRRPAHIVWPRQIAEYLAVKLSGMSENEIGKVLGNGKPLHHTTIRWSVNVVENAIATDKKRRVQVEDCKAAVRLELGL